jgi:hypothetical protein
MSDEIQIHILHHADRYHVVLRHPNGREEISDQSFATEQECKSAIEQYVRDRKAQIKRPH